MNTSTRLLEEKYVRAAAFGKYLDDHPDKGILMDELKTQTCLYRIAIANVLADRLPKEPKKRARKTDDSKQITRKFHYTGCEISLGGSRCNCYLFGK